MKKILPALLVLSLTATAVHARQPAEIVQLGGKYYGRDASGGQAAHSGGAAPVYNSGSSQVISSSGSAGSSGGSGGSSYYDNNTYQAVGDTGISVKDNLPAPAGSNAEPSAKSDSYYSSKPERSSEVTSPEQNYSDKVAVSSGQKLRWQSGATELERNYREQDRMAALAPAAQAKQEPAPEAVKVEENPLKAALEDEVTQSAKFEAKKPAVKTEEVAKEEVKPMKIEEAETKPLIEEKHSAKTKLSNFIWPAKGKVISRFGAEESGVKNDGIAIALPEGTSVQAASAGTVIYVGDELEGFGNLVIVRHSDNWVTAYGHNQKAMVKRGDKVAQGQVIALSGNTGNVSKPQLYFSIRKGKEPMDPLRLLEENNSLGKGKLDLAMQGERI